MEVGTDPFAYYAQNTALFWEQVRAHGWLSLIALAISIAVCVPLGIGISRYPRAAQPVINLFNAMRVIPSLVILFLALPYLGIGNTPALVALTILAFPPVLINTYAGLRNVDRAVVEAATGMGMSGAQVLGRVELPLAMPAIIAGIRTAAVEVVASATLAAFIGGDGLGKFITRGFALNEPGIMLVGAVPVALMAIAVELGLGGVQRLLRVPT